MKRRKNSILKKSLPLTILIPLTSMVPLTSCGILNSEWSWKKTTKDSTVINYCLLIGQNDHTDSIERTRATRIYLDTYDKEATEKVGGNANVANPKQGELIIHKDQPNEHKFIVNEIEHLEQKSMAGATWDPITANNTTTTWIAKHGDNITFFVSNNDSMAEGAYWACNWIKGLPIFGYDANPSTIGMINSGYVTGTVDQNASTQCGAAMMILRNMFEDKKSGGNDFGKTSYDPMNRGFAQDKQSHGWVDGKLITKHDTAGGADKERAILSASTAITKKNAGDYLKEDGTPKKPIEMTDVFTHITTEGVSADRPNILMTYNNKAEVFLVSTLKPYFNEYASRLNIDLDVLEGDGTGEGVVINQIKTKESTKYDGYLINMTYTTSAGTYIEELAQIEEKAKGKKAPEGGWDNFDDRYDTPVIFWNRQPQKDGKCDTQIMNNKYFKYVYFIGVDAAFGGEAQGKMIVEQITNWYDTYKEGN